MKQINDFIAVVSQQLNEPENNTRQATGALLSTLKSKVDAGDFQQLMGALPGANDLITKPASQPATATAGVLGGALGAVAPKLGGVGGASGALGLVAMIQQTGFSPAKVGGLVQKFMELVRGNAGDGLTKKLFAQLPELATLAA